MAVLLPAELVDRRRAAVARRRRESLEGELRVAEAAASAVGVGGLDEHGLSREEGAVELLEEPRHAVELAATRLEDERELVLVEPQLAEVEVGREERRLDAREGVEARAGAAEKAAGEVLVRELVLGEDSGPLGEDGLLVTAGEVEARPLTPALSPLRGEREEGAHEPRAVVLEEGEDGLAPVHEADVVEDLVLAVVARHAQEDEVGDEEGTDRAGSEEDDHDCPGLQEDSTMSGAARQKRV